VTIFNLVPFLTVPLDNVDTSTIHDHVSEDLGPDETVQPSAAADKKKSNSKPTASATVKLLRGVTESPSAFGPLKSVARSLCFILDNCGVRPSSCVFNLQCLRTL